MPKLPLPQPAGLLQDPARNGVFTLGLNTYYIDKPSIVFIHPNDFISWKKISNEAPGGYYCLFRKEFVANHPQLKATIDRYGFFMDKKRSLVRVADKDVPIMNGFFARMLEEELSGKNHFEDAMQAYIQLMMIESSRPYTCRWATMRWLASAKRPHNLKKPCYR